MGLSPAGLGLLVGLWLCHLPCVVVAAQWFLDRLSSVHCGPGEMTFYLPLGYEALAPDIAILDNKDKAHPLKNDSSCGLWIEETMEKTPRVTATLDGCYPRKEDEKYVVTLMVDRVIDGELDHHKKDITCPINPALDAPSASDCAAIPRSDRLACANNLVTQNVCEGLGCCFNPEDPSLPCYFGNKLTAQCTLDGQAMVAISKDLTVPSLILDSVHVVNVDSSSCPGLNVLKNSAFISFVFPLSCGGMQVLGTEVTYENIFEATKGEITWQGVSITRDSTMRLVVQCLLSRSADTSLMVEVRTLPPPPPISTTGPLFLEMRIAKDEQYSSYYQDAEYPIVKGLRDLVFIEVRILGRNDPSLVLLLNDCWATPTSDPNHQMQWDLLVNSCPSTEDDVNYRTRLSPVPTAVSFPSYYSRFIVSAFVFVNQQTFKAYGDEVYFHCSASVCTQSAANPCQPLPCSSRQKRAAKASLEKITVSKGPVDFVAADRNPHASMSVGMEKPLYNQDLWYDMLNETDEGLVDAEGPVEGDLFDVNKLMPRRVKGDTNAKSDILLWLRGVTIGGSILLVVVTILGIWKCHRNQRPAMHAVNI